MRRIAIVLMLLCLAIGTRAENKLTLSSAEGAPGDEVTVSIALANSDAVSSLQVSIPLDDNLALVEGSGMLGSRCADHSLTVGVKDGVLNVLIYSVTMAAISGDEGEVASFRLKLGSQPKTVALTPQKITLSNTDGQTVESAATGAEVTTRCAKAQYDVMEVDFGEVPIRSSYERTVTVTNVGNADLTVTGLTFSDVHVFSSTTPLPMVVPVGVSKTLNVTYAPVERGSISKTLRVECNSISKLNTIALKAQPFAVNELHVQPASGVSDEEVTVFMTMNNMDAISGYQVEYELPQQFAYVDGSFELSSRKKDHVSAVSLDGNRLRIIAYSPSDQAFDGDDGVIGSFRVRLTGRYGTTLTPVKTVLSATINSQVENVVSAVYGGYLEIRSPLISCDGNVDFGAVAVTEVCEQQLVVRNYGSAPLTISRVTFGNEALSVKEELPLSIPTWENRTLTVVYDSQEEKPFETVMNIYSNDPELRMRTVNVSGSRFAPNYLRVETPDVFVDEALTVRLVMDNYDAVEGVQFDLEYPAGYYSLADNSWKLSQRAEGMTVTTRQVDEHTLRYFCYFLSGQSVEAGNGEMMTLTLQPQGGEVADGQYVVAVRNVKMGTSTLTDKYAGQDVESIFTVKTHRPVTVTATSYTRQYGEPNPTFAFTTEGAELIGTPAIMCEATAESPVGEYPIVISKGTVMNEEDTYANGTLTITKAPLVISVGSYTKEKGDAMPDFVPVYSGWKNNETSEVLIKLPVVSCEATAQSKPGEYAVTVAGAEAQNYEISYTAGVLVVTVSSGVNVVKDGVEPFAVYSLAGVLVRRQTTTLKGLPSGVYLVKGQKIIVR